MRDFGRMDERWELVKFVGGVKVWANKGRGGFENSWIRLRGGCGME